MVPVVVKIKPDEGKVAKAVSCKLYEDRKVTKHDISTEEEFINTKMGISTLASNISSAVMKIKYGI